MGDDPKKAIPVLAVEFLVFIVFVAVAAYFFLIRVNKVSYNANAPVASTASSETSSTPTPALGVELTQTYSNPFDANADYTNPFDSNNPFANLK